MAEIIAEPRRSTNSEPWRLRSGAIFGGALVALGLWALLYVFGLAVGLSSVDAGDGRFNFPAAFTGIWAVVTPLLALFIGGLVAARTAGAQDRLSGAIHGAVLWGLTTLLGAFAIWSLISLLAAGAAGLGRGAAGAAGQASPSGVGQALNIQTEQLLGPINQRLQEQGHPTITAQQLQAAAQDAANRMLMQGRVDRGIIEQSLAQNTQLDRQNLQQIAGDLEQQFNAAMGDVEAAAARAAEQTGKAMWGVFFALLLGLASSVFGAAVGTSRKQERLADSQTREIITPETGGTTAGTTRRGEVYP
jgi:fumarate reductase subunit D